MTVMCMLFQQFQCCQGLYFIIVNVLICSKTSVYIGYFQWAVFFLVKLTGTPTSGNNYQMSTEILGTVSSYSSVQYLNACKMRIMIFTIAVLHATVTYCKLFSENMLSGEL